MQAIAFTHLVVNEKKAFGGRVPLRTWVRQEWKATFKRFAECKNLKIVYIFLSNAYQTHLIAANKPSERLRAQEAANREDNLRTEIRRCLRSFDHTPKFVLVGLHELVPLLAPMEQLSKNSANVDLNSLFLGEGQQIFYDCPKIVEALIRIARRNDDPDTPIFRFDEDVQVSERSIAALINEYQRQRAQRPYYFFSGNYKAHNRDSERTLHLLNDYSVRVQFLSHLQRKKGIPKPTDLAVLDNDFAWDFLQIVGRCGADLENQPISGAGLCISPLAVVQLPPFANVANQIMWIDDDLKRRLHLGIGDLKPDQDCFVPKASFRQDRHPGGIIRLKDVNWGYEAYLPRVVMGCLMNVLMYDANTADHGAFAESFASYMGGRNKPTESDRYTWAREAIGRLHDLKEQLCSHPRASDPVWKPLADFARSELDYSELLHGEVVRSICRKPSQSIEDLCTSRGLSPNRNAGAYVAEVISDLHKYVELVDVWPYIVRTIDFLIREPRLNEWLLEPRLL